MLLELEITNFALIDNLKVEFQRGLNILTGETGAGKSIIIDALNMVVGDRADREFVRTGSNKCRIQAIFSLNHTEDLLNILNDNGIDLEDDTLIINREIHVNGRSVSRINGVIVNQSFLKLVAEYLIDIHGQHEHQSLMNSTNHIHMLDAFGSNKISKLLREYKEKYKSFLDAKKELNSICNNIQERERQIELLKYQINEIDSSKLKVGEDEELEKEINILSNSERIISVVQGACNDLYNGSQYIPAIDLVSRNLKPLLNISSINEVLKGFYNTIEEIQIKIDDVVREMRAYLQQIDHDPTILESLESRLNLINNLKRKYGNTIKEIIDYRNKINNELEDFVNSEVRINKLEGMINKLEIELKDISVKLSTERKLIAVSFENGLQDVLKTLNMNRVTFTIRFEESLDYTPYGIDKVEFLISTNIGEPLKSLTKVASGGEISRIMLAFKTILANVDKVDTLIFDEIDTGISGNTAQIVGEKLREIAEKHQIICITHLPQIASMANEHFLIEKNVVVDNTKTTVTRLTSKERVNEIGRLLGGELTDLTLKHAKEMITKAKKN
ncbi:DNA repair protein RecN [Serpentinicella alkaliphila]|uniref:DNA repair protein RecN n=1 Tax=Serpentinicella alkaliphila TaxID=1734049 RepID=A0A4R2TH61_9FIRM|nr:DNA repair protein RecN [Serpentinicella alkaliphila]QUH26634.1 DNA repair protein RecN [Serpentinicella alkaliphila]TCQ02900.1 DNA replication and repair protein RecN [Serpentinicella alkaliphila]